MPRKPTKSQTGASTRRNDENNAGPSRRKAVRKISSEEDSDDNQTRQSQRSKLAINGNKIGHFSPNNNENKAGPSRRKALRAISSSEESDDNQTRGLPQSSSSANTNHATIQNGDANATLVNNMVKYFLNFSATKIPIKKADIIKNVNVNFKIFPEIYKICIKILKKIYGLEVSEIEGKSAKVYIVYSSLCYGVSALQLPPDQRYEVSLLFIILSYIFMKGGEIQEAHLLLFLDDLDIDTNEPHKIFGDVTKLIREKFTRQLYLKRTKFEIEGTNDSQIHLAWGARAEKEFDKKKILKSVAGIMNKSPAAFINQYHEANNEVDEEAMEVL